MKTTVNEDLFNESELTTFLKLIIDKKYDEALLIFDNLTLNNKQNKNFILFLLSLIIILPEKYKNKVKHFTLEDILLTSQKNESKRMDFQNEIRISAYRQRLFQAKNKLVKYISHNQLKTATYYKVIMALLNQAIVVQQESIKEYYKLVQNKKYNILEDKIANQLSQRNLTLSEQYIFNLIKVLKRITSTKIIPKVNGENSENVFHAIKNNNFEEALIAASFQKEEGNILYAILRDINFEIAYLKSDEKIKDLPDLTYEENLENEYLNPKDLIEELIEHIINCDINNIYLTIKRYLNSINQGRFLFVVIDLVKLSIIEKDYSFKKVINMLKIISAEIIDFNIDDYVNLSYEYFKEKPYIKVLEEDFFEKIDYFNLEGVVQNIINRNTSLTEVLNNSNLTEEEKTLILLIFARESYAISEIDLGNKYYLMAERMPNKTQFVKKVMEDIRKNKLFYPNRVKERPKTLIKH